MDAPSTTAFALCAVTLLIGAVVGFHMGSRRAKAHRRELQQALNNQSVELLEARKEHKELARYLGAAKRKDRLLKLSLIKLKSSNSTVKVLRQQIKDTERRHYIEMSGLNVSFTESKLRSKQAIGVAKEACFRLRLLERALPQLQTISAPEPKSYGQGEAVTVSVVDQHAPAARHEQVNQVSNRDLKRLTSMEPSNEQVRSRGDNTISLRPGVPTSNVNETSSNAELEQTLNKNETATSAT